MEKVSPDVQHRLVALGDEIGEIHGLLNTDVACAVGQANQVGLIKVREQVRCIEVLMARVLSTIGQG